MKFVVFALLSALIVLAAARQSIDFTDATLLQDAIVYELDMSLAADPNYIDMVVTGTRGNGAITFNISDPESLCIDNDPNQCGGNVQYVIIRVKSIAGKLYLDNYINVPGMSQGNVTELVVAGYWNKDAFKLMMSYIVNFRVDNSAYGVIRGTAEVRAEFVGSIDAAGNFIGKVIGINAAYTSASRYPYQIVVVNSQLDMRQQRPNILISRRGNSAYYGAITRFIPYTNIHSFPSAYFVGGSISNVVFANNQISGTIALENPSAQLAITNGTFTASIGQDADIEEFYNIYNGIVTDSVHSKTYYLNNNNIIANRCDE